MALAHKWRMMITVINQSKKDAPDPAKSGRVRGYSEAIQDLEEWITAGKFSLIPDESKD